MDYDNDNDSGSFYGTAFPPLEANQNAPKKGELDLTVRDEKGRRRFHGAFTGGFSAGYFNTVGTKEGWTPSQFISSRKGERNKRNAGNKPEDFMDEEDFGDHGIAPKMVRANEEFSSTVSFAGLRNVDSSSSVSDALKELIKPCQITIGMRLYRAMKHVHLKKIQTLSEHVNLFQNIDQVEQKINYEPKTNFHGLGYKSLTPEDLSSGSKKAASSFAATMKDGKKLQISGEAFGYGALEDEDDDDADYSNVYSCDDLSKYDFALESKKRSHQTPAIFNKYFGEGSLFDYFVKDETILPNRVQKKFDIPRGWRPKPPFAQKRKSRFNDDKQKKEETRTPTLNANVRSLMIGEQVNLTKKEVPNLQESDKKSEDKKSETESIEDKKRKIEESQPSTLQPLIKKPLQGFFAHKFVQGDETLKSQSDFSEGLTRLESVKIKPKEVKEEKEEQKVLIGKIKRKVLQWHPHKLLCKRFNVPHPYPQFPDVVGVLVLDEPKKYSFFEKKEVVPLETKYSVEEKKSEKEIQEEIQEKPSLDIFKAIFASDEEDNLEDFLEEEPQKEVQKTEQEIIHEQVQKIIHKPEVFSDNVPSTSGIKFNKSVIKKKSSTSNVELQNKPKVKLSLDFDDEEGEQSFELKKLDSNSTKKHLIKKEELQKNNSSIHESPNQSEDDCCYGPELPKQSVTSELQSILDEIRTKKSKKKDKKSKKKSKEKRRHKHKKRSSPKSSQSSSD